MAAGGEKSFVIVCVICMKEFKCDLKVSFLSTNVISIPGCALEENLKKKKEVKFKRPGARMCDLLQKYK